LLGVVSLPLAHATPADSFEFEDPSPNAVLMKGPVVLQKEIGTGGWYYYDEGGWNGVVLETFIAGYFLPRADLVSAGTKLHIRIDKPPRPERLWITAHEGFDREQKRFIGEGRRLDTTLRRVQRDGKTVAWDVFFHVNRPHQHYYLKTFGAWKRVPGTHSTYGSGSWTFHVKTC